MIISTIKILATSALLAGIAYLLWSSQPRYTQEKYQRIFKSKFQRFFSTGETQTDFRREEQITIEQAAKKLQKKLLLLLNGDRNTATRLIKLAKTRNPHKSIDWCVEKVIFDLQRDRGRY